MYLAQMHLRYHVVKPVYSVNHATNISLPNYRPCQINQYYRSPCCRFSNLTKTMHILRKSNLTIHIHKLCLIIQKSYEFQKFHIPALLHL